MCKDINRRFQYAGADLHSAVLFMNSNKSEQNLQKIMWEIREKCLPYNVYLQSECIINKGPDRDIDREAINALITLLITGKYEVVIVPKLTDLTDDIADLKTFIKDAAKIGVSFFELATMQYGTGIYDEDRKGGDGTDED